MYLRLVIIGHHGDLFRHRATIQTNRSRRSLILRHLIGIRYQMFYPRTIQLLRGSPRVLLRLNLYNGLQRFYLHPITLHTRLIRLLCHVRHRSYFQYFLLMRKVVIRVAISRHLVI